jgi:putative peptidoglycan lipid II flippase
MSEQQPPSPTIAERPVPGRGKVMRAAGTLMIGLLASGILGLVRQVVISATFGAGQDLDAFYAALRVPETLFVLVAGGALGSAFIPVFSRFLAAEDTKGAWTLASATLTFVSLFGTAAALIAFILAPWLVETFLVPGAPDASQALTVELMRIMLVTVVIFGASGLVMGILNGNEHFSTPALAPTLYNLGLILGALLAGEYGVHALAWGAVLGALMHLGIQIPVLSRLPGFRLRPAFAGEGLREVLFLMGPRVLGLGVVQLNFWVNTTLTSDMAPGSLTALTTAFALMFTVLGVLGQSVGTAVFPTLSRLHAEGQDEAFGRTLLGALSSVLFLSIPAGFGLAALSNPIITVLFERGEWSSTDTQGAAWALTLFSVGLAGHAALEVLARAFYALHDTWTPVRVGGLTMLLNIVLSFVFIRLMGYPGETDFARGTFGGLALSMTIATAIESSLLWFLLRRRIHLDDRAVLQGMGRTFLASSGMLLGVWGWLLITQEWHALIRLLGGVALGGGIFWAAALFFRIEEARIVPQTFLARFYRRR